MIAVPDTTPGYELVRRRAGEPCIAVIHHPPGSRRWHITYRGSDCVNVSFKTRKAALADIERVIAVCSDHQLGLEPIATTGEFRVIRFDGRYKGMPMASNREDT